MVDIIIKASKWFIDHCDDYEHPIGSMLFTVLGTFGISLSIVAIVYAICYLANRLLMSL